jgi:hypothetical protein
MLNKRRLSKRWWLAGAVLAVACRAGAQSTGPECSLGWSGGSVYGGGLSKAAYTLTVKHSVEQQLINGSYVRAFSRTRQARASDGRTMQQMPQQCLRGEDGQPKLSYSVSVMDQKARTNLYWTVGNPGMAKEAQLSHMISLAPREPVKKLTPAELEERRKAAALQQPPQGEYKREDLGTKMIAGVEARGTRSIRTIPPGEEGNELPLVITDEIWTAKELGIVLLGITDDPRRGKTTYEVEELTLGEPDASLFAPPEGYTIKDVTPVREGVAVASAQP